MATRSRTHIPIPGPALAAFCSRYHVQRLSLFGSVLQDTFRPDSDVDVLVVFEPGARVGFVTLSRMQRELSALFGRRVDLVPRDGLKAVIRDAVLANVEEIYAA